MSHHDANRLDRHAYIDSVIHRLDPRAKVVATFVFIMTVVSYPKYAVAPLIPFVFFPMIMAIMGFVPMGLLLRRLLIASPFIVFIGIFNPLLDRMPMFHIGGLALSGGWMSFISILLRGFLCVGSAIVLIATTSMPKIAEALGELRAPRALVVQLMLLYRYLFILLEEASRMSRARALRAGAGKARIGVATGMISTLLLRTVDRSDSVWQAMQARGFDGQLRAPRRMKWKMKDTMFLLIVIAGSLALRIFPVTRLIGERFFP